MPKMRGLGVALQARIPRHQICQQMSFWMPRMGVFEMRNAKKVGVAVALQVRIPLHQIWQQTCLWIPRMGVFKIYNAKKGAGLAWRSKRAYLCTKQASKIVFGCLGWGGLKWITPKNVGFSCGAPSAHTSAPNMATKPFLDPQDGGV